MKGMIMSEIVIKVVVVLIEKLDGEGFDGLVKFVIEDEGVIIIDGSGVYVGDEDIDVILIVIVEVFQVIFEGE